MIINKKTSGPGTDRDTEKRDVEEADHQAFFERGGESGNIRETRVETWKEEWEISATELCNVIKRKKRNTAPGPDGITLRLWRKIPGKMVERITKIMNKILKEGKFPSKWKIAKLVLIPKAKKDESDIPKARPICLIDDIGKYLEKIIVERINNRMEYMAERGMAFCAIGKNQYGFRKNRSTIDALYRVKEIAEGARTSGETAVMISLDIENAFNSIPWAEIRKMLVRKKIPAYLIRILNSYLRERYVEFPTIESNN